MKIMMTLKNILMIFFTNLKSEILYFIEELIESDSGELFKEGIVVFEKHLSLAEEIWNEDSDEMNTLKNVSQEISDISSNSNQLPRGKPRGILLIKTEDFHKFFKAVANLYLYENFEELKIFYFDNYTEE